MRTPLLLLARLRPLLAIVLALLASGARADNVVARYHFAGASALSHQTNFDAVTKLFKLDASLELKRLAFERFSTFLASGLPVEGGATGVSLQPLLDDCVDAESVAAFGGSAGSPLQFVVALRLDGGRVQAWEQGISAACQRPGEKLTVASASGWRWGKGTAAFWLLRAGDWLLVGRGADLNPVRDDFLAQIQQQGRPAPALKQNFLEADVDWAALEQTLPINLGGLKPARAQISLTMTRGQIFRMTAHVTYPAPFSWSPQPWKVPVDLVRDPLISFTAAQNLSPFLANDVLSGIPDNPLQQQFFCWSQSELPFQSYMAWPVPDGTNEMRRLAVELPNALGPKLKTLNNSFLNWTLARHQIVWNSVYMKMIAPTLSAAQSQGQSYLLAEMFPRSYKNPPAPPELFDQFNHRSDIVYYDWELTGRRLEQWRLLSELLPIMPRITPEEMTRERMAVKAAAAKPGGSRHKPSYVVADNWLNALAPSLNMDTTTEVSRTGPAELLIKRRSPFLFTSLELELLTHWMCHAPAVGRVDANLLPQPAKMTGPGVPSH